MKAIEVAKWFINELHPEPLKLQKLLYLAQGFSFAFYDRELFEDNIEAWVHGPVVPIVYHEYSSFKYNPISMNYELNDFSKDDQDVLNYVKDNYAKYDSKFLEEMTHNQEPWLMSRDGLDPDEKSDKTISKSAIASYFTSFINQPEEEAWD
ncbi:MAG TPA: hypothetical protein DCE23_00550 [Firmicutes bacterium]|nr:hypothetical protein [Bacillota bacterium]